MKYLINKMCFLFLMVGISIIDSNICLSKEHTDRNNMPELLIEFKPLKNIYFKDEPIWFRFILQNNYPNIIYITNNTQSSYLELHIYDEKEREIEFIGRVYEEIPPGWNDVIPLCSNCTWEKKINLIEVHGEQEYNIVKQGRYKVKGVYTNYDKKILKSKIADNTFLASPPCTSYDLNKILNEFWEGKVKIQETNFEVRMKK